MNDLPDALEDMDLDQLVDRIRNGVGDSSSSIEVEGAAVDLARAVAGRVSDAAADRTRPNDYPAAATWATALENEVRPAMVAAVTIAAFDGRQRAAHLLTRMLQSLSSAMPNVVLAQYPALLLWYAAGTVLVSRWRLSTLREVGLRSLLPHRAQHVAGVMALQPWQVFDSDEQLAQWVAHRGEPDRRLYTPVSQRLEAILDEVEAVAGLFDSDFTLETSFDRFEWATGLLVTQLRHDRQTGRAGYMPPAYVGCFSWRDRYIEAQGRWSELVRWTQEVADALLGGDKQHHKVIVDAYLARVSP